MRRRSLLLRRCLFALTIVVLLSAISISGFRSTFNLPAIRTAQGGIIKTDRPEYPSGEIALITGSGFKPGGSLDVLVLDPEGKTVAGIDADSSGWESLNATDDGFFAYGYRTITPGAYMVRIYDSSDRQHSTTLATSAFRVLGEPVDPYVTSTSGRQPAITVNSSTGEEPAVSCDKSDYAPSETVTISGSGFIAGASYDIPVRRPNGTIIKGDGTGENGWDSITTAPDGSFTYHYELDGVQGTYTAEVYPSPWSGPGSAQSPLAATTFTDCLYDCHYTSEWAMITDQSLCRSTFIIDPGVGATLSRGYILDRSSPFTSHGWSLNFLWYSYQHQITVTDGNTMMSYCTATCSPSYAGRVCPDNWVHDPGDVMSGGYQIPITLSTLEFGGAWIDLGCGNYNAARTNPIPRLVITKFWDKDRDGVKDANEPVLSGWRYNLSRTASSVGQGTGYITYGTTGPDGTVTFALDGQGPGTYAVDEVSQSGWVPSTPTRAYFAPGFGIGNQTFVASFGNYKSPTLTLIKNIDPDSDPGKFNLQIDGSTCAPGVGDGGSCIATLSIGSHTVGETAGSGTDLPAYEKTIGGGCAPDGSITLGEGDNKTCTITNRRLPHLTVVKDLQPDSDPGKFNLQIDGATCVPDVGDGGSCTQMLSIGPHTVGETAGVGTSLGDYDTVIGDDCASDGTINLAPGDNKTCTITNRRLPHLTVVKDLQPDHDPGKFNLQIDGGTCVPNVGDGGSCTDMVSIGSHTAGETAGVGTSLADYAWTIGGDCAPDGSITLAAGDNKTCSITNRRKGSIIVAKETDPASSTQDFVFTGDVSGVVRGGHQIGGTSELPPGIYTSTEIVPEGWHLVSITCDDNNSTGDISAAMATFRLDPGETVRCTFTNSVVTQPLGTIIVKKQTIPDGAAQAFTFTGNASGTIGDDQQIVVSLLAPGTYTSTETVLNGWSLTSISCNDGNSTGDVGTRTATFRLEDSETITCTFTNTRPGVGGRVLLPPAALDQQVNAGTRGDDGTRKQAALAGSALVVLAAAAGVTRLKRGRRRNG